MSDKKELLSIQKLNTFYGESHVLHDLDLNLYQGELIALLGRNGSGRSTVIKSIMGLVPKIKGSIQILNQETINLEPHRIARLGLGYCPEDRGIFSSLTVEENFYLPPKFSDSGMTVNEIFTLFPNLKERLGTIGTKLSGGEQQMLALARILRTGAQILLLDEITEGLAPVIVQVLGNAIQVLKERGYTIILVEQNFRFTAKLADRYYVLDHGEIKETFSKQELKQKTELLNRYLSV